MKKYCLTLILLLFASVAQATTWYVSTTGSDSNSCTAAQNTSTPKASLRAGIACLQTNPLGNRLEIRGGTYSNLGVGGNTYLWPSGTNWSNAPVIAAYAGETVIMRPPSIGGGIGLTNTTNPASYMIFDRLILDGQDININNSDPAYGKDGDGFVCFSQNDHIRFQNGEVKNFKGNGFGQGCPGQEILNSHIHHNGDTGADHGLYNPSTSQIVEGNEIDHNGGYGIHWYGGDPSNSL